MPDGGGNQGGGLIWLEHVAFRTAFTIPAWLVLNRFVVVTPLPDWTCGSHFARLPAPTSWASLVRNYCRACHFGRKTRGSQRGFRVSGSQHGATAIFHHLSVVIPCPTSVLSHLSVIQVRTAQNGLGQLRASQNTVRDASGSLRIAQGNSRFVGLWCMDRPRRGVFHRAARIDCIDVSCFPVTSCARGRGPASPSPQCVAQGTSASDCTARRRIRRQKNRRKRLTARKRRLGKGPRRGSSALSRARPGRLCASCIGCSFFRRPSFCRYSSSFEVSLPSARGPGEDPASHF